MQYDICILKLLILFIIIFKNNEKNLRDNLNKAKIRINQEVNSAKEYKDKLNKIKNKFI